MADSLKKNDICYTKNNDGTVEKWYFICIQNDLCYVRKGRSKKERWSDYIKAFPKSEVFKSRREALNNA